MRTSQWTALVIAAGIGWVMPAQASHPIQVGVYPPAQLVDEGDSITGARLNLPYSTNAGLTGVDVGLFNRISGNLTGLELGIVNVVGVDTHRAIQVGGWNDSQTLSGLQFGLLNRTDSVEGLQFGIVNMAKGTEHGLQLGLLNYNPNARLFKYMPLISW